MNQSLFLILIAGLLVALLFLFNHALVKYYTDPLESIKPVLLL